MRYTLYTNFTDDDQQTHEKKIVKICEEFGGRMSGHGQMLCTPAQVDADFEFKTENDLKKAADEIGSRRYSCRAVVYTDDEDDDGRELYTPWSTYSKLFDTLYDNPDFIDRLIAFEGLMLDIANEIKPEHQREMLEEMVSRVMETIEEEPVELMGNA